MIDNIFQTCVVLVVSMILSINVLGSVLGIESEDIPKTSSVLIGILAISVIGIPICMLLKIWL